MSIQAIIPSGSLDKGQGFAILIVEDQALIALEIEDAVRRNGADVVGSAARLSEALTLIEMASWDAAFLDMKLADGEEVYPVAEQLQSKGVPFAFLTAWDGDIDARYRDVPVLSKPFSLAELENCLQTLVGGRFKPADREAARRALSPDNTRRHLPRLPLQLIRQATMQC